MSAIRNKTPHFFEFGPFRLDAAERLLFKGGEVVPLTPKVIDTLLVLVENRGHLIAKEELMSSVWPDSFVEDSNLTQNISLLRKALGEEHSGRQYIETLPKRGYRFVAEVKEVEERSAAVLLHRVENAKRIIKDDEVHRAVLQVVGSNKGSRHIRGFSKPQLSVVIGFCVLALATTAYLIQARWSKTESSALKSIAVLPFKTLDSENDSEGL